MHCTPATLNCEGTVDRFIRAEMHALHHASRLDLVCKRTPNLSAVSSLARPVGLSLLFPTRHDTVQIRAVFRHICDHCLGREDCPQAGAPGLHRALTHVLRGVCLDSARCLVDSMNGAATNGRFADPHVAMAYPCGGVCQSRMFCQSLIEQLAYKSRLCFHTVRTSAMRCFCNSTVRL